MWKECDRSEISPKDFKQITVPDIPMEEECSVFEVLETGNYIIATEHFPTERRNDNNG